MMNNDTPAVALKKNSSLKKDALCLVLVVIAVFILHIFSKNTVDQLYKTKVKDNPSATDNISTTESVRKASVY